MRKRRYYSRTRSALYTRIPIIPGWLYINISRSGISLSFGRSSVGRINAGKNGVRLSKTLPGGFRISKNFGRFGRK